MWTDPGAWMDMNRQALEANVSKQLSVDEDDDVSASMDEMDEAGEAHRNCQKPRVCAPRLHLSLFTTPLMS